MSTIKQDLDSFSRFVTDRVGHGNNEPSLDELFDLWRLENPSESAFAENVAAIAASIEDFKQGERGSLLGTDSSELRREFGLTQQ